MDFVWKKIKRARINMLADFVKKNSSELEFKVNGLVFCGIIKVNHARDDLYNLTFIKNKKVLDESFTSNTGKPIYVFRPCIIDTVIDLKLDDISGLLEDKVEGIKSL